MLWLVSCILFRGRVRSFLPDQSESSSAQHGSKGLWVQPANAGVWEKHTHRVNVCLSHTLLSAHVCPTETSWSSLDGRLLLCPTHTNSLVPAGAPLHRQTSRTRDGLVCVEHELSSAASALNSHTEKPTQEKQTSCMTDVSVPARSSGCWCH